MKKFILSGLALLLGMLTTQAQDVTVVDNINDYTGTEAYVYSKADGKTYARNNLGAYELYGVYVKTNTLNIADPSAKPKVIDYIATDDDNKAYINTGYVHKANTRVVADVMITQAEGNADKWRAVFGSRKGGGGGATNGLVYFYHNGESSRGMYKRNVTEYAGADQNPKTETVPINDRITIDANGHVLSITKYGELEVFSTIKTPDEEELSEGVNPLFIFDLSSGDGTADGSRARMKLYGFKIYEDDVLVKDYEPVVNSEGKGGLHEKKTDTYLYSADANADFLLSPDATDKLQPGIPVYPGKMVLNTTEGKVYKYDAAQKKFVLSGSGERTLGGEIANSDYKNMKNWNCPNDHWQSVFDGGNNIQWNEATQTNTFDPYVGTGGWEPLRYVFNNLEANADYKVTFNYSTGGWKTWSNDGAGGGEVDSPVIMPFKIIDREKIDENNGHFGTDAGWINGAKLTPDAQNDTPVSVDFNTPTGIATFIVQFGVVDDGSHDPAYWFKFANFSVKKYNYPEAYPVLNPYKPLLQALIAEVDVEKNNLTTTYALETALTNAFNNARAVVDGDDISAQKAALNALQAAYGKAKDVNVTILKATITLAQAEGVDVTAANAFLAEGTTADALNSTLEALRMARKQAHFEQDNATYAGHEPFAGKFYLYNVGRKNYLTSGSNWGTHLALGWPGLELTATADGDGYKFQFQELTNGARNQMMTADYVDGETGWAVTYVFEAIAGKPGVYALKNGDNYLSFDPEATPDGTKYYNSVTSFVSSKDSEDAQWIIVTKEDRLAQMDNATAENPVDATVLIKDASFNKYADLDNPWNDLNQDWWYGERIHGDKNTQTQTTDGYDLSQTIIVPRAGTYKLKAQSYYRDGSIEAYVASVQNSETLVAAPKLYAQIDGTDVAAQAIKYLHEDADKAPGEGTNTAIGNIPDGGEGLYQASKFFENGLYWNEVEFTVDADNTPVKIGIKKPAGDREGNWVVTDNFRLIYVSAPSEVTVTVDEDGKATFSSSFALDFTSAENIKAYKATTITDDNIVFEEVKTAVPAGTGLLLVAEGGATEKIKVATDATALTGNLLKGTLTETEVEAGSYLLGKLDGGAVKFYKTAAGIKSAAGKAYLPAAVSGARSLTIVFADGEATGISQTAAASAEAEAVYSLTGQKLATPRKGVNVLNGKKVIVK